MTLPFLFDSSGSPDTPSSRSRRGMAPAVVWVTERHEDVLSPQRLEVGDEALVTRLRVGDEQAFRELWTQYHVPLADFALRYVGAPDLAADVVQDVFIALWERHADIVVRGALPGYLYGMVRYTAINVRKHQRVVQRHGLQLAAEYAAAPVVAHNLGADVVDVEIIQRVLAHAVAALAPRTREIFLMSREDGLSPAAIAAALGITPQVVYNQLTRALKAIRAALAEENTI